MDDGRRSICDECSEGAPKKKEYGLICPFLEDSPLFAAGVEFGMLYCRMSEEGNTEIKDHFHSKNQERILLLAKRLGWSVEKLEKAKGGWFYCEMTR